MINSSTMIVNNFKAEEDSLSELAGLLPLLLAKALCYCKYGSDWLNKNNNSKTKQSAVRSPIYPASKNKYIQNLFEILLTVTFKNIVSTESYLQDYKTHGIFIFVCRRVWHCFTFHLPLAIWITLYSIVRVPSDPSSFLAAACAYIVYALKKLRLSHIILFGIGSMRVRAEIHLFFSPSSANLQVQCFVRWN